MENPKDIQIIRDLAKQYAEIASGAIQEERRHLWTRHNSLKETRPLVLASFGMWNVWCRDVFGDDKILCEDPFFRDHERTLRMKIFQDSVGDDNILEPWITQGASHVTPPQGLWGLPEHHREPGVEGGSWKFDPALKDWEDLQKLVVPHHIIDEEQTAINSDRLRNAVGDIIDVNVERGPVCVGFNADISTRMIALRGLEQTMIDMYESPEQLHELLAFMRDGILTNNEEAEKAGDLSLTSQQNQCMDYCEELEPPKANSGPRKFRELWGYFAAQEYTLISPAMHDEFLLQYQLPIISQYGLTAYGCCEDLTNKIDMLRKIPNLRIIGVTPVANVAKSAEQIGTDYVISWRPNPADMVCCGFNEDRIRRIITEGMESMKGCRVHIHLKDVETLEGEPERLEKWVQIVRDISDNYA